ncbi:MAG TPA: transporter [Firmicutes bacterium]|jgi:Co/Zn/Cd efflux system component|nr:transporter [Bacillota bacterium]
MDALTQEQRISRERTLLTAVLLSVWAPLATGIAVILSQSTTQLADCLRRNVELLALLSSWLVFRHLARNPGMGIVAREKLERLVRLAVAVALSCSGVIMLVLALTRFNRFEPGGNVYPGLAIAGLGLMVNLGFWLRYRRLNHEQANAIIGAQGKLYQAKSMADLCVITALAAVAIAPGLRITHYFDIAGSIAVALYLLWSAWRRTSD